MENKNFIRTTDPETKDVLIKEGFTLLSDEKNGVFIFLNNSTFKFTEEPKNIAYTNIACV